MTEFPVPLGQHPPLAVVSDTDHTAWIIIATALGLTISILFGVIRVLVRTTAKQNWGLDDISLAVATLLTVIQSSLILSSCSNGLGKSIELVPPGMVVKIQQLYYTNMLLFVVCLGLSKISITFFLLRLTPIHGQKVVFRAASALVILWTIVFLFAFALQCNIAHPWVTIGELCPGTWIRWRASRAFDIAFELGLVGLAAYLVWGIQTHNSIKILVVFAFCSRLPMIVAIIFRLKSFSLPGFRTNPTLLQGEFIVWTQTELNYSLISATIPCLRPFVANLATYYGGFGHSQDADGSYMIKYGSRSVNQNQNFQMDTLNSANRDVDPHGHIAVNTSDNVGLNKSILRPLGQENDNGDWRRNSLGSNDSQRMIIRKDVTWAVE